MSPTCNPSIHLMPPPPDPRAQVPDLSDDAAYALRRALAKSPDDRWRTAGEFVQALNGSL